MIRVREEQGATAITVAVMLLMIMGFVSLAIDTSLGLNDRRGTQNASDSAALAAAWEDCNPKVSGAPNPIAAARRVALENGYDHGDPDIDVAVNDLSAASSALRRWEVQITSTNETHFGAASVTGATDLTVLSRAVGECEELPFLGGYAIFAGAEPSCNGGVELDLSGASQIVNGGVHSNGDVKVTGSDTEITGTVTYRGSAQLPGDVDDRKVFGSPLTYPVDVAFGDYRLGGSRANAAAALGRYMNAGSTDITDSWIDNQGYGDDAGSTITLTRSGIYFTEGDITLTGLEAGIDTSTGQPVKASFVAGGQVKITGSSSFAAYDPIVGGASDPGVAVFSNYLAPPSGPTCTGNAIQFSVSSAAWTGVMFAPFGQANMSFASGSTLNGGIFAYTVNISGSDFQLQWQDNPNAEPEHRVQLSE